MGTIASKKVKVKREPEWPPLTTDQKKELEDSWRILSQHSTERGCRVFDTIFQQNPNIPALFCFGNLQGEKLHNNIQFRSHAQRFMSMLCAFMENINNYSQALSPLFIKLGREHISIVNFDPAYFKTFETAMFAIWSEDLGERFTPECRDAWNFVLGFIQREMVKGYEEVLNERGASGSAGVGWRADGIQEPSASALGRPTGWLVKGTGDQMDGTPQEVWKSAERAELGATASSKGLQSPRSAEQCPTQLTPLEPRPADPRPRKPRIVEPMTTESRPAKPRLAASGTGCGPTGTATGTPIETPETKLTAPKEEGVGSKTPNLRAIRRIMSIIR